MTDFGRRPAVAGPNVLPKTGQEAIYYPGDDGYYQRGWEDGDRFTDNGDGTITDNATNLMWPKDANGPGGNCGATATWTQTLDYAEALNFAGHTDWRLPNRTELASLMDHGPAGLTVIEIIQNAQGKDLYASTTHTDNPLWVYHWYHALHAFWVAQKTFSFCFICCRDV